MSTEKINQQLRELLDRLKRVTPKSPLPDEILIRELHQELGRVLTIIEAPDEAKITALREEIKKLSQQLKETRTFGDITKMSTKREFLNQRERLRTELKELLIKPSLPYDRDRELDDWLKEHWGLSTRAARIPLRGIIEGEFNPRDLFDPAVSDQELQKKISNIKTAGTVTVKEILQARQRWFASFDRNQGLS